jgi:hypothetical protein
VDSIGNGTVTRSRRVRPNGGASPSRAAANSQRPLRLTHSARVSCGRGYSGSGRFGLTCFAQRVLIVWFEPFSTMTKVYASNALPSAYPTPPWPS